MNDEKKYCNIVYDILDEIKGKKIITTEEIQRVIERGLANERHS